MDARLNQGAEVSLSGNLGFVSLDEVLRLLTRAKHAAAVDITGDAVRGRIFVDKKGIALATTLEDDALSRHLSRSGLVTSEEVASIASGALELADMPELAQLTELLREMSVESLYQMGLRGTTFDVREGQQTPFAAPAGFDPEELLAAARQRLTDWEDVRAIVSEMDRDLFLNSDLGDRDKVTIDRDSWKVISVIGNGVSIRGLADRLGTTEFWAAQVSAGLVEEGLVSLGSSAMAEPLAGGHPTTDPGPAAAEWEEPAPDETHHGVVPEPLEAVAEASADEQPVGDREVDHTESWWQEPDAGTVDTGEGVATEPAGDTPVSQEPSSPEHGDADQDSVEEDTESFLEKVFSELEAPEEAEEGYGLLRRRRMGTLRDGVN
jgi:hypothetical protein